MGLVSELPLMVGESIFGTENAAGDVATDA